MFQLPPPNLTGLSFEEALERRRTVRNFCEENLDLQQISQVLHAAAGITGKASDGNLRSVPSAGALYPVQVYLAANYVDGLPRGFYQYKAEKHNLETINSGDQHEILQTIGVGQRVFTSAPALLLFAVAPEQMRRKYRNLTERFLYIEVGHAAQNVLLQASSLGLGAAVLGVFKERELSMHLGLAVRRHEPVYMLALGVPAKEF